MLNFKIKIHDEEVFVNLISVAKENREVKDELLKILALDSHKRKTMLDVLLKHTKLQLAPEELRKLFALFQDDELAQEVLQYLQKS